MGEIMTPVFEPSKLASKYASGAKEPPTKIQETGPPKSDGQQTSVSLWQLQKLPPKFLEPTIRTTDLVPFSQKPANKITLDSQMFEDMVQNSQGSQEKKFVEPEKIPIEKPRVKSPERELNNSISIEINDSKSEEINFDAEKENDPVPKVDRLSVSPNLAGSQPILSPAKTEGSIHLFFSLTL